jgi:hypothetical protein
VCDAVIPSTVTLKARCCSRECGITYQNRKRTVEKIVRIAAERRMCEACGEPIPPERHGAVKFCSWECKHRTHNAYYRERYRGRIRETLYGLTEDQYNDLLRAQGGTCAICRRNDWPGRHHSPCVDHDHTTGVVRGLLCDSCNQGLGRFGDDPARLRAAADYLGG